MKIKIAETAGFCMGVKRAVDLAVDSTSNGSEIYSIGPLIHNNQALEMLHDRGIKILNENEIPPTPDSTILIRAHGIPPELFKKYSSGKYTIIDGTCPKVKTVHRVIKKYNENGFNIIIIGDKGHAEVIGLLGHSSNAGYLVQNVDDVNKLPELKKICIVSQTTFNSNAFDEITDRIKKRYKRSKIIINKTICAATYKRQEEARELAQNADAMIVVGGKNSANTLRLAGICRECDTPTYHIETEHEIDWKKISYCKTIGITAGASTPAWMIKRIIDHIHFLIRTNQKTFIGKLSQFFEILANINFFVAAGGITMYYASSIFQEFSFEPIGAVLSFLYLMSIYLWNSLTSVEKKKHLDISRYRFYNAHRLMLTICTAGFIAALLGISLWHSTTLFYLMLFPTVAGCIYHLTIVPSPLRNYVKYSNLKDIPTSRDLFAAIAWAVLITFIPHAVKGVFIVKPATAAVFLWTFLLAYYRSLIFDLRDIEGDRIMGRETLVTIIGEKKVKSLIFSMCTVSFIILICLSVSMFLPNYRLSNVSPYAFILQIPVVLHIWIFMKWLTILTRNYSAIFNILADGQFYIVGLGAWIAASFIK